MIRPEFSGQVRNVRKDGGMSAERQGRRRTFVPDSEYCQHRLEEKQTRQLVQSYAKEGTWQGKGPRSPRERRRSKRHPIYASSSLPQAKEDQLDLSVELREVGKRLQICHQDFTSSYMKRIIRDMDERKSSDAGKFD